MAKKGKLAANVEFMSELGALRERAAKDGITLSVTYNRGAVIVVFDWLGDHLLSYWPSAGSWWKPRQKERGRADCPLAALEEAIAEQRERR